MAGCTASMARRIIQVVEAFVGGAIVAIVVTVVHGEGFPWILGSGLVVVALFLASLRLLSDDRLVTVAGALGVIGTVLVLAQRSEGGSVLIAANDAGNVWVIGAAAICGLASAWPSIRRDTAG